MRRVMLVLGLVGASCTGSLQAAFLSYSGTLSGWGGSGDGLLLTAGGEWSRPNTILGWVVDNKTTQGKWHYEYTITVPMGDVQCAIIETSDADPGPAFTEANLFSLSTDPPDWFNDMKIGTHSKWDNVNLPEDVYGIKLCADRDPLSLTISFDSDRPPVWGDFYARSFLIKDPDGDYFNTLYNWGLMADDPLDAPRNGSINNHVLVPDSVVIPAPCALLLGTVGVFCSGFVRRWWL